MLLERYQDFEIYVRQVERGIKLELRNAPASAFVDGQMIKGIHEHLFSVLRDVVFVHEEINNNPNIDAEAPNSIVNNLTVFPDIEKRLEGFVRVGHGVVVFAGGVGTAEEILYLLGLLLHPDNSEMPFPLIMTGPESARAYFA